MNNLKITLKAIVFWMSALLLASSAYATEEVKDEVKLVVKPIANGKKVLFGLAHLNGQKAQLQISNDKGAIIYTESWKDKEEGAHIFNFSKLEEGEYTMRVTIGEQVLQESVFINSKDVKLGGTSVLLPHINVLEDKVTVSLTSPAGNDLNFKLNFYDAKGELVYTESPKVEGIQFAKRYNFEKMGKGEYSYTISQGDKNYEGNFEIK